MKENTWKNAPEDISKYQGYVYIITEIDTGMLYIGKKNFWKKIKRKPLKGKKRRRISIVESDWKTYNSSNKILQEKIELDPSNYEKNIIELCSSKQDMAIYETAHQIKAYLNGEWGQYFNEVINIRVRVRK